MPKADSAIKVHTEARLNFDFAIADVERLLTLYDAEKQRNMRFWPQRTTGFSPPDQIEVLKRAAIILSVTAWESFIEDTIRSYTRKKISDAAQPKDVEKAFNHVADSWLKELPKPPGLAQWAGDGWKYSILAKLQSDLAKLNTPTTANIRAISKRYIGIDISQSWSWARMSASKASERLDTLIKRRGDLAHRSPEALRHSPRLRRRDVADAIGLLKKIVACTEKSLGVDPRTLGRNILSHIRPKKLIANT